MNCVTLQLHGAAAGSRAAMAAHVLDKPPAHLLLFATTGHCWLAAEPVLGVGVCRRHR